MLVNRTGNPIETFRYSTEEKYTGKNWIDGKKIYSKSFQLPNITNGKTKVEHGISNFGRLIGDNLIWYDSAEKRYKSGNIHYPDSNFIMTTGADERYFHIESSSKDLSIPAPDWSTRTNNVVYTMYYTKN